MLAGQSVSWYEGVPSAAGRMKEGPVSEATRWWDGNLLAGREVALALFASEAPAASAALPASVGAALVAAAGDEQTVLLHPGQLGPFLTAHATVSLVCHDAAALHWGLHDL